MFPDLRFKLIKVITRKLRNRKTTLYQYLSVFDVVTKQSFTRHLSNQLQKVKWVY